MDSFMVGLDVRDTGRTRVSILEPAYDMTVETFSFQTDGGPSVLERRLEAWSEQGIDIQIAICVDDEWPYNVGLHLSQAWHISHLHRSRIDSICRRAEAILECRLRPHRSKLMAFMTKYDILDAPCSDIARRWAIRMAREFLFAACHEVRPYLQGKPRDPGAWQPRFLEAN